MTNNRSIPKPKQTKSGLWICQLKRIAGTGTTSEEAKQNYKKAWELVFNLKFHVR